MGAVEQYDDTVGIFFNLIFSIEQNINKTMKKFFEAVLVAVLMLGFSACQNEPEGDASIVGS